MKDKQRIEQLKSDVNVPKHKLMEIVDKLYYCGAIREAKSLEKIIIKLEIWQNK